MSTRLPSRENILGEGTLLNSFIAVLMAVEVLLAVSDVLYFSLFAWLILFWIAKDWAQKESEKLNALRDCFDAPVTGWPPMSLDHFKWVVWNCELRGREITKEDAREYFTEVMDRHLRRGPDFMASQKVALSFGRFARELPNHAPQLYDKRKWECQLRNYQVTLVKNLATSIDLSLDDSLLPLSSYELIDEPLPANPVNTRLLYRKVECNEATT